MPINGEVRMLAALEGVTGVLYVAITVALLVSAYKQQGTSGEPDILKKSWALVGSSEMTPTASIIQAAERGDKYCE